MQLALCVACALVAGDWPQFRGANSDGHAGKVNTPLEWSDSNHVAWKVPIPGLGWSSPSVVEGKVYLTTAVARGPGLSLRVLALDAQTGKVIWDKEVRSVAKAPSIHTKNSHASPTPLVRDGAVYAHFGALGMYRLAAADGNLVWECNELDYPPRHGSGGTPVLHDGKLVVACDGSSDPFVAAVDATTGKVAWKTPRSIKSKISHSFVTATITLVDGKPQVLAPGPDHFAAYDLATGAEIWRVMAPGWSVVPQPAVGHGMVFYNHDYDNPELMGVNLGGKGDVTATNVVWRIKKNAPSTPSPLLVGDELYFVSDKGVASCVDARTGEKNWMERLGGEFSASPVLANGRILFLNETGQATWIQPGKKFAILGKNQVPGRTLATPAFTEKAMFLRTDEFLYKIAQ